MALGFTPTSIHTFGSFSFFLTAQKLKKMWTDNLIYILQLRKLMFLKKVTYLLKLASSSVCCFPGRSLAQFSRPHKGRPSSSTGAQDRGAGWRLWSA